MYNRNKRANVGIAVWPFSSKCVVRVYIKHLIRASRTEAFSRVLQITVFYTRRYRVVFLLMPRGRGIVI